MTWSTRRPQRFETILRTRAEKEPERSAFVFLSDGETEAQRLSYGELDVRARALAGLLFERGAERDERAMLFYPPGLDFIVALLGCFYAGLVAVPAYPPRVRRASSGRATESRLQSMVQDARPTWVLATSALVGKQEILREAVPELVGVEWLATDGKSGELTEESLEDWARRWREPMVDGEGLAILQYTSGSTSTPKGVMVSHGNLLHNEEIIRKAFNHSEDSVIAGWLPLYHDMGLIGNVLQPLYIGGRCILMPPTAFLARPVRWLDAISRYGATTGGGPNFAYELCVERISEEDREKLDLRTWGLAFSGAEPVRATTLERFSRVFESCGFKSQAFYPCYGLAEGTLFATGGAFSSEPITRTFDTAELEQHRATEPTDAQSSRELVSCGREWEGQEVAVVDVERGERSAEGHVGEIWLRGPSVAQGYFGQPEKSRRDFEAFLEHGDEPRGPFLRTGDLGFLQDGELYVTGRLKDLLILRGRNHYPQDLELTAERAHPWLRPGCSAAFGVEVDHEETLVLVCEVVRQARSAAEDELLAVIREIRQAVAEQHEVRVQDVVLIKTGAIPKTTSGKIRRSACRANYLEDQLPIVGRGRLETAPAESTTVGEGWSREALLKQAEPERQKALMEGLRREAAKTLRIAPSAVEVEQPLTALGLDSLGAVELKQRLAEGLEVPLSFAELLAGPSLEELAHTLGELLEAPPEPQPEATYGPEDETVLSEGQKALWFLHRLAPKSGAYHIASAARVSGQLEVAALEKALAALAMRHPMLRSTFEEREGEVCRVTHPDLVPEVREIEAADWTESELSEGLKREAYRPFDLGSGPLLRLIVFRGSRHDAVLLAVHHIITDFWSLATFVRELGLLYSGVAAADLESLPWTYGRYVRWQRDLLAGPEGERLWDYWRTQLADLPAPPELPTDRARPPVQTYRGAVVNSGSEQPAPGRLEALARSRGVSLFMVLLTAFEALLSRTSGQERLLIGTPTAGRDRTELSGVQGYFVNPVVLHADLRGRPSFFELLERVRQTVLGAFDHQAFPFPWLAERLQPERDASRSPLYQVMIVLQKAQRPEEQALAAFALGRGGAKLDLTGLRLQSLPFEEEATPFDLALRLAELEEGLGISLQYNSDLFDRTSAERMLRHYRRLLAAAVEKPELAIAALPLLSLAEEAQLVREWNDTARSFEDPSQLVHQRFEACARQRGEALAMVGGALHYSYGELNRRANRLAHALMRLGVGPEMRVGVLTGRVPEMVLAMLAIWKAGGAYVPLDPAYPKQRLELILEDAGIELLLTLERLEAAATISQCQRLDLERVGEIQESVADPEPRSGLRNLAYGIYTSGSTGRPKGVAVTHEGLLNLVHWHLLTYPVMPEDRATQVASPGFDAVGWEIWPYLAAGASLQIPDEANRTSGRLMVDWLVSRRIVWSFLPTPLAEASLLEEWPERCALRALLTGGDRLHHRPSVNQGFALVNHYGPTENSVVATWTPVAPAGSLLPDIGRPLTNVRVHVLDKELRPVPVGVAGEIYLGGDSLARGYLQRPAWTAERFVPNPLGEEVGARLYGTGDSARLLANGAVDFLDRIDHQVKVRGHRIELGEIETLLIEHPGVREAVVLLRSGGVGDEALVAFVTTVREPPGTAELKDWLHARLPAYMVPSAFVFPQELPLSTHGKVDRSALLERAPRSDRHPSVATARPETPVEELLAGIFSELLHVEQVDREADFFELGGHSLLATRLITQVSEACGVEVAVSEIFEHPTVAALAAKVEGLLRSGAGGRQPPILPADRTQSLPLSFAQERLWFLDRLEPGSSAYNIPAALEMEGELDIALFTRCLDEIEGRHEALRTTFRELDGEPLQVIAPRRGRGLAVVDLSSLPPALRGAEAQHRLDEEARRPFDLRTGPLLRTVLLRLTPRRHVFALTFHHIASDGWSLGVLVEELVELYRAALEGRPPLLELLPLQYADFALWQRAWLSGEELERQLAFWRLALEDVPPVLELPTDRPHPPGASYRGAQESLRWPALLGSQLTAFSQRRGATLFMTLLAAFSALLARLSGRKDLVVGAPIANRRQAEIENLIGFFVNTLALRADLSGDPTFEELLRRIRAFCLGAFAHQDLPFEKLVEELQPDRDLSRSPIFQVMFALQSLPKISGELPGLRLEPREVVNGTTKFDLTLAIEERAEGFLCTLEYATDSFDSSTVRRIARHLETLLEGIVDHPTLALSELPLLSPSECQQVFTEWNDRSLAAKGPEATEDLYRLFAKKAASVPDAVAVEASDGRYLTYRDLDLGVLELAQRLESLGIGPEVPVGVCTGRSPELVIALLAILRTGGIYVPLNPEDPPSRLALLVEDSGVGVLLVRRSVPVDLPQSKVRQILLDEFTAASSDAGIRASSEAVVAIPTHCAAWVIYTSGSTGRPKGVVVSRGAALGHLLAMGQAYGMSTDDRWLHTTAVSFDVSLEDFLVPLLWGATVVLPDAEFQSPGELLQTVQRQGASVLDLSPAFFQQMAEEVATGERGWPDALRLILVGGDVLSPEAVALWQCSAPNPPRLLNVYGPTEATITTTFYPLQAHTVDSRVPIGRGIGARCLYVLDPVDRPVPIGVAGELRIGGPLLARGYLDRPRRTAEVFAPDPFASESAPGARLYKTGDRVRYLADGRLDFLGRLDRQIKVRGFRIELGEVEAALSAHEGVGGAAAVVRESPGGDARLVAYVAPHPSDDQQLDAQGLRSHLGDRLPAFMMPSAFVVLDALPLLPSGKVNRAELPEPDWGGRELDGARHGAWKSPVEELLAGIWTEVLGREAGTIGRKDSFFELGGHSLLATQVISRVREVFGIEIPVRELFESPTVEKLASAVEASREGRGSGPALRSQARPDKLPLSFAQERLWFLDRLEPGGTMYHIPASLRIQGMLDLAPFTRCLNEVFERHEALRTIFPEVDGKPYQAISAPLRDRPLPVVDLSVLSGVTQDREVSRWLRRLARHPFQLATGPLLRMALLRLGEQEHIFAITFHHIVTDGWSVGVLVDELTASYGAMLLGKQSPLQPLPVQYADFALWQRAWLEGEELERQLAYWRRQLAGAPPILSLPTDRPRMATAGQRGERCDIRWSASLSHALEALSRRRGTTLFMTLMAAFFVLLARYGRQRDVVIGSPIANRNRVEIEGLIGFFVNTLALRTVLTGDPTFEDLLGSVRHACLDAFAHQDLPFEKLVEELRPERHLGRTPVFQVLFALQNTPPEKFDLPGLTVTRVDTELTTPKFDWTLSLSEDGDGLEGFCHYRRDLFDPTTIRRMTGHLESFLRALLEDPKKRLSELSLLGSSERQQVSRSWNDTRKDLGRDSCLHELFEAQVVRTPDATSLRFEQRSLSFGELNARANQLALQLQELGVGPEVLVGICWERSLEMIVALLAIFKAGGAYVPLDPTYPEERLVFMLEDAGATVLLTNSLQLENLPALGGGGRTTLCLEATEPWLNGYEASSQNPAPGTMPENLAYVIYTSGSTGRPKGVEIAHRQLVNYVAAVCERLDLGATDSFATVSTIAADLGNTCLFPSLLTGGCLHVIAAERIDDPEALGNYFEHHAIDCLKIVPSHLAALLTSSRPATVLPRRRLILGGEASDQRLVDRVHELAPGCQVFNHYGPTEATIGVATWQTRGESSATLPLGRPLANCSVHLLDSDLRPVPVGVPGELYIGGVQLARGYFQQPAETAASFFPDPFSDDPGARIYGTGDLARHRPNGTLYFLGRLDHQVKIRGFRVEAGEIEAILEVHPSVDAAVVVPWQDGAGEWRLAAHVVAPAVEGERGRLQDHLRRHLPEAMVPSHFAFLEALPLSPNGKVDLAALPAPESLETAAAEALVAPRTPLEELLTGLWAELLGVPEVGTTSNFFDLGGHSLLATQLVSRVRRACSVELSVRSLFEAPTVAAMAALVEAERRQTHMPAAPPIVPVARGGAMELSFAQERMWLIDQLAPGESTYNLPYFGHLRGVLDVAALEGGLGEIVRRHDVLRTTFPDREGQPVQHIAPFAGLRLRRVDLEALPGGAQEGSRCRAEAERIAKSESLRPFDLAQGPLLRATIVRLEENEHFLLLTLHHIVSDAWSRGILLQELSALYGAAVEGGLGAVEAPLPELTVQYADFAHWQRQWLEGEVLEIHLEYWRRRLSEVSTALELPTDRPRPAVQGTHGEQRSIQFSGPLSAALQAFARRQGSSLFMVLLAGFQALLSRLTRQEAIPVGAPIANRNQLEVEELIGLFVNTLVFHTETSGDPSFEELLARVRTVALEAYAHQDLPFEKLVDELRPERDLSRTPLFQVFLDVQRPPKVWRLAGLETRILNLPSETAKFDLELFFEDRPEGLAGEFLYSTDLFDGSTIERLARHLRNLLAHWVEQPECSLSAVNLLAPAEYQQLVVEWNATERPPYQTFVHRVVEEWAHLAPETPAVAMGEQTLGYGRLNQLANRVAAALGESGVGPEEIVGVFSERGIPYLTAMLGIFKAGGAYLPVDPLHPPDRIRQVLELSAAKVVLFAGALEEDLLEILAPWPADRRPRLLRLELLLERPGGEENPSPRITLDHLAYVIYTSGSTGIPKGAMLAHREMLNHLQVKVQDLELGAQDVVAQTAPQSFDISVWQFLVAILVKARTQILDDEQVRDPQQLLKEVEQRDVTVLELVPSQMRFLHEELVRLGSDRPRFEALRWLIPTGEALPPEVCRRWLELYPRITLLNAYGPAECADDVTHHAIPEAPMGALLIPIGRPVGNVQVHVLDAHLRPVPLAVAGEVCVGGIAVGRGYLGDPRRTAKTFVPNPLASGMGERLYRTGDLGRYGVGGAIEFLGRIDFQVKVHGLRIELGEIEARLNTHPAVRESVLLAQEDAAGETRLVAYFSTGEASPPTLGELREYLGERLPVYMVPWVFCFLEEFPLLANGKVNRRALPPASELLEQRRSETSVAPRTPLEQRLAEIWAEVLGIDTPGVEDNFFELGGHSLLATRLLSRMRQAFQVEIPLRVVFEDATIASLAHRIERVRQAGEESDLPPLVRVPRDSELPLSYGQQSLWFLDQLGLNRAAFNIADAFRVDGVLDLRALERVLVEIFRRHEILRTRFPARRDGKPLQVITDSPQILLPKVDLSGLDDEKAWAEVKRRAREDALHPFDLSRGPLLRIHLLELGPRTRVLLFAMHHIISDGWSIEVLMKDLITLYDSFSRGLPSPLEELSIQYADFAYWQRQRLEGGLREAQLAWWKERLAGAPAILELPLDRQRPEKQSFRGTHFGLKVSEEHTSALMELGQKEGVTLFMTLLAAFKILLSHHSGQEDILVASPVAYRKSTELESLIGFFVNTLALRTDLSGNPELGQLLARVREVVVEAHAHDDLPFDRLVVELQPERNLGYNPLVQVAFTLDVDPSEPSVSDLDITPLSLGTQITQYDLILGLRKEEDGLSGWMQYSTDLFEHATIARLALGYETILAYIAKQPGIRVVQLKERMAEIEEEHRMTRQKKRRGSLRQRLKTVKRESIQRSE